MQQKLRNLLQLLDDDSPTIQKIIKAAILKNALSFTIDQEKYRNLLISDHLKQFNDLMRTLNTQLIQNSLHMLIENSHVDIDLEKAMLLISKWESPNINCNHISFKIDKMSDQISETMPKREHPLGIVDHLNNYIFNIFHFSGNSTDYYNPHNSFLHKLLETKKGIPISLSILFLLIARRLDIPLFGVPLPAHFILKFYQGEAEIFFDPFYQGRIYSRETCISYLQNANIENVDFILGGCRNIDIIMRVLKNLRLVYSSYEESPEKTSDIELLIELMIHQN
jgi:regulator of sirC expression with transglutaminase-like and TPR domain